MNDSTASHFRQLREELGYTQRQLAEELGYSRRTIHRWESGESEPRRAALEFLRREVTAHNPRIPSEGRPQFTFIDLFAGIGGMRRGFERVGGRCVFTSEIDKFCWQTYRANFDVNHETNRDIKDIEDPASAIPPHDLLLAGFPCQPFSISGVSKRNSLDRDHGFDCDVQGTLFFDIARILRERRPAAFLLENVKNLKNHDGGQTYRVIRHTLEEDLGYSVTDRIIDAQGLVPQHRERVFIVGFDPRRADDTGIDFSWEDVEVPDPGEGPRMRAILHPEDGSEEAEPPYTEGEQAVVSDKYTLSDRLWEYLQEYKKKHRRKGNGFGYGMVTGDDVARTMSARYHKDGSEILISQDEKNRNPRRMTPREAARIMGFDWPGYPAWKIPVSDTQAYQQFGNAVVVPVVEAIARAMKPPLESLIDDTDQLSLDLSKIATSQTA